MSLANANIISQRPPDTEPHRSLVRVAVTALVLATAGCNTARSTYEYDPAASQSATFWLGLFFVSIVVGSALVWCVYLITEAWKDRRS